MILLNVKFGHMQHQRLQLSRLLLVIYLICSTRQVSGSDRTIQGSRQLFADGIEIRPISAYKTEVVAFQSTVIEMGYSRAGRLQRCRLSETWNESERQWLLTRLSPRILRTDVNIEETLEFIEQCGRLDTSSVVTNASSSTTFPGTLWCGPGDSASSYADLGSNRAVDRCCRDHDFCPVRAIPGELQQPLRLGESLVVESTNLFTVSHCRCDEALRKCLHNASQTEHVTARAIIFLYGVLVRQCLEREGQTVAQSLDFWDLL